MQLFHKDLRLGAAHFADQIDVLLVMLGKQRIADAPAVLVTGNAPQRVAFAVQNEALLSVDFKEAATLPSSTSSALAVYR